MVQIELSFYKAKLKKALGICFLPSVLIFRAVLTKANKVALNITVPSLFRGMFMATNLCRCFKKIKKYKEISVYDGHIILGGGKIHMKNIRQSHIDHY